MDGGTGRDRLSYADATSRVVVDMLNGTVLGSFAAGDLFFNFEDLEGGADGDLLLGDNAGNVIEARIGDERRELGRGDGPGGEDYASLLAEFERLAVDREFAEEAYRAALAAFDQAQAEARRKSRYLAAHINPTLAETSEYPRRWTILALIGLFATGIWALGVLIFYSLRDRR